MDWTRWALAVGLAVLVLAAPVAAARERGAQSGGDRIEQAMGRYNLHPAFEKLGRGLANSLGGWLEIPLGIHRRFSPEDTAGSFLTGAARGLFRGLVRTGVGIYETATFFVPYPEDFRPILPTLAYFDSEARKTLPLE